MSKGSHPVLVGVAQRTYRDTDPSRTPVDALQEVAEQALSDSGSSALRERLDCVIDMPFLVRQVPEMAGLLTPNPGSLLAERMGLEAEVLTSDFGGNLPQWFVNRAADDIVAGRYRAVLIAGCELMATLFSALRSGADLSAWQRGSERQEQDLGRGKAASLPVERSHGLFEPINTYPLFESALRHHHSWSAQQQAERLGRMVSAMSHTAAANPHAWKRQALSPEQVLSTDKGNRMITWPYTKAMNAILAVDMAAAVILTSAAEARAAGVPEEQMIHLHGGAEASDVWHLCERVDFHTSPALHACAQQALGMAEAAVDDIALFDLYSCFPSAVQVACDSLGLDMDDARGLSVTGGLMQFGGPGNNYSLHAIAEMVQRLRQRGEGLGLVSANGGYLTKHAVGVYGCAAPSGQSWAERERERTQQQVDAIAHPKLALNPEAGELRLEAHSVGYGLDKSTGENNPRTGYVVGRLASGERAIAHAADDATLQRLLDEDCVGQSGHFVPGEAINQFRF